MCAAGQRLTPVHLFDLGARGLLRASVFHGRVLRYFGIDAKVFRRARNAKDEEGGR